MRSMTHKLRKQIREYIKSGLDISELIENVIITGEDLSYAKISQFNRICDDLSGTNFRSAIIGTEGKTINLSGSKMVNTCFKSTRFNGKVFMRRCDCRGANFCEAWIPFVEYQKTDFRGCSFCDVTIQLGSRGALGAIFDLNFFKDLGKALNMEITCKRIEEKPNDK